MSHDLWYQQRYGNAQAQRRQRQNTERINAEYAEIKERREAKRVTFQGDAAAIFSEHQVPYEKR